MARQVNSGAADAEDMTVNLRRVADALIANDSGQSPASLAARATKQITQYGGTVAPWSGPWSTT